MIEATNSQLATPTGTAPSTRSLLTRHCSSLLAEEFRLLPEICLLRGDEQQTIHKQSLNKNKPDRTRARKKFHHFPKWRWSNGSGWVIFCDEPWLTRFEANWGRALPTPTVFHGYTERRYRDRARYNHTSEIIYIVKLRIFPPLHKTPETIDINYALKWIPLDETIYFC
ncbi:hypothetical protein OUZ56_026020 [Daphnia magna]|uniref:Uncharacterized protein n=1 Tax=Daphnia magna TaxID=35525 RepID=A0ABQ9ZLJ9_9CRUS|nr:hypothetical protein OUZ56_026020 [Daphnia magna]